MTATDTILKIKADDASLSTRPHEFPFEDALVTCSQPMLRAVQSFAAQEDGDDLNCAGISRATLRALQSRGLIRMHGFEAVSWRAPNGRRTYHDVTFTVSRCF